MPISKLHLTTHNYSTCRWWRLRPNRWRGIYPYHVSTRWQLELTAGRVVVNLRLQILPEFFAITTPCVSTIEEWGTSNSKTLTLVLIANGMPNPIHAWLWYRFSGWGKYEIHATLARDYGNVLQSQTCNQGCWGSQIQQLFILSFHFFFLGSHYEMMQE